MKNKTRKIRTFCLLDDVYFTLFMKDCIPAAEALLHSITGDTSIRIQKLLTQDFLPNPEGRSVSNDFAALDTEGRLWIAEMQRKSSGATGRRSRYFVSMHDVNTLRKNEDWEKLQEITVIFITEHDSLHSNRPITIFFPISPKDGLVLDKGVTDIFVNCAYKGNETGPLMDLIHDIHCRKPKNMRIPALRKRALELKNSKGGRHTMFEWLETHYGAEINRKAEIKSKKLAEKMAGKMAEEMAGKMAEEMAEEMAEQAARDNICNMFVSLRKKLPDLSEDNLIQLFSNDKYPESELRNLFREKGLIS